MAENKPIVISMKMLADVKDADKLLKYVHELGQQLKKAGGRGRGRTSPKTPSDQEGDIFQRPLRIRHAWFRWADSLADA